MQQFIKYEARKIHSNSWTYNSTSILCYATERGGGGLASVNSTDAIVITPDKLAYLEFKRRMGMILFSAIKNSFPPPVYLWARRQSVFSGA